MDPAAFDVSGVPAPEVLAYGPWVIPPVDDTAGGGRRRRTFLAIPVDCGNGA